MRPLSCGGREETGFDGRGLGLRVNEIMRLWLRAMGLEKVDGYAVGDSEIVKNIFLAGVREILRLTLY